MMTILTLSIYTIGLATTTFPNLETYRSNYSKAATSKTVCEQMMATLKNTTTLSSIERAYLGRFQTIYAKHVINPINKLKTFKQGKKNIEEAVEKAPDQIEIRFIRLSVQKNAPVFLGYKSNINEDRAFIRKNIDKVNSTTLRNTMEQLMND